MSLTLVENIPPVFATSGTSGKFTADVVDIDGAP
jgi:hypothetical protein